MCVGLSIPISRSSSAAGPASAAILFWIETPMQLSTLNGSGWPSWDIQPERFNIRWAGHRPLLRSVRLGQPAAPLTHNLTVQREESHCVSCGSMSKLHLIDFNSHLISRVLYTILPMQYQPCSSSMKRTSSSIGSFSNQCRMDSRLGTPSSHRS